MASASFVEIISRFAGYLQIFQDIARDRIEYDEIVARRPSDDYSTLRHYYERPVTPDDLDTEAVPTPALIPDDPVNFVRGLVKALSDLHDPDLDSFPPTRAPNILLPMPGGGGGGGSGGSVDHHIRGV